MADFSLAITAGGGDTVAELRDHSVVLSFETQKAFAEVYGDASWRASLTEPAVFWFETKPPTKFRPHFIGSTSGASNTWMWGWENINGFPADVVEIAHAVHGVGEQLDLTELTTSKIELDDAARASAGLPMRSDPDHDYVLVALALAPIAHPVYYRAPTGQDSFAWFIIDNDDAFTLGAPTPLATVAAISEALASGKIANTRLALQKYAERRGGVTAADSADGIDLVMASGRVHVEIDEQGRVARISTEVSSTPAPTAPTSEQPTLLRRLFGKKSS